MKQDKSVNSSSSGIVVGEGSPPWLRHLRRSFWQSKKSILPVVVLVVVLVAGVSSYFAFFKKDKPKAPVRKLTPLSELEYKPTPLHKAIQDVASLVQADKINEAKATVDKYAATASDKDKHSIYSVLAGYCKLKQHFDCVDTYYTKVGRDNLTLSQMLDLADAQEKLGKKTDAKNLLTYIKDNKSKLYEQLETKDAIDKRVNDGLQRLSQ